MKEWTNDRPNKRECRRIECRFVLKIEEIMILCFFHFQILGFRCMDVFLFIYISLIYLKFLHHSKHIEFRNEYDQSRYTSECIICIKCITIVEIQVTIIHRRLWPISFLSPKLLCIWLQTTEDAKKPFENGCLRTTEEIIFSNHT